MKQLFMVWLLLDSAAVALSGCESKPQAAPPVRVRWANDPESLDPLLLANQYAIDAANLLHQSLLQVDFVTKRFSPALADSLPATKLLGDSVMLLTYRLRPAATWDNGQPVTGHDVALTLKLMQCPGLPNEGIRAQFGFIRAIQVDSANPRKFTLVCQGQAPEYIQASGDFFILSEAALDPRQQLRRLSLAQLQARARTAPPDSVVAPLARHYLASLPAPGQAWTGSGCGPYQLVSWERDNKLRFRRKPKWWADKLRPAPFVLQAQPSLLEFAIIPDEATATLALQRGDVDIYPQLPAQRFAQLQQSASARSKLAFYTAASYDVVAVGFNTRQATLADRLTRQALSRLFDVESLLRATQLGEGQRTIGLIHPTDRLNYNDSLLLLPFDPGAAAALLRQAGWQQQSSPAGKWQRIDKKGITHYLTLRFRYRADDTSFETIALQFRAAAAKLGVPVELVPTEGAALTPTLQRGDFDLYVRTIKGNSFIFNFMPILHSQAIGAGNFTGYGTPASDRLLEAIAAADEPARKAQLLRRFQTMLQADAPLVPLFFLPTRVAASRQLTDLHVSGLKPGYLVTAVRRRPLVTTP